MPFQKSLVKGLEAMIIWDGTYRNMFKRVVLPERMKKKMDWDGMP